jgi:hypothetical protein
VMGFHMATGSGRDARVGSSQRACRDTRVSPLLSPGFIHEPIAAAQLASRIK